MDTDDLEPRKRPADAKNLDVMSIEALGEYIADLEAEIQRARAVIADKEKARDAANAVFK